MRAPITQNNFDLLRLFAALQVATLHVSRSVSTQFDNSWWVHVLECFSGVPIFFFISGFLISRSLERSKSLTDYAANRALRIFPALHVCVFLNLLAVALTGYFITTNTGLWPLIVLYGAKTTIFQFYNPDFMRGFGDGVLNGSLWTICVELQFYLLTPIIYRTLISGDRRASNISLLILLAISLSCNRILYSEYSAYSTTVAWKLARVSFLPWIYMYLTGLIAQRNFDVVSRYLSRSTFWFLVLAYIGFALLMQTFGFPMDNSFSPLLFFPLAALTCAAAYYPSARLHGILQGNDISYGVYIYHVPVMNMFLYFGARNSALSTIEIVVLAVVLAILSWTIIERPALRHKRHPSHAVPG